MLSHQSYANKDQPLWLPYNMNPSFSTIVVNGSIQVDLPANASWDVVGINGSAVQTQTATAGHTNVINQAIINGNNSTIQIYQQGFSAGDSNFIMGYTTLDLDGTPHTKGAIQFLSSINNGAGGVVITGEEGSSVKVNGGVSLGTASDTNQMKVSTTGIVLKPGVNLPVLLSNGYMDINNLALSNVSSINGQRPWSGFVQFDDNQPTQYISTGGALTPVQIVSFPSTIMDNFYRVTANLGFQAIGGGNAGDYLQVYVADTGSGATSIAETVIQNTINPIHPTFYGNTVTAVAQDNNGGGLELVMLANSATDWNCQIKQIVIEDLGYMPPVPPNNPF